MTYVNEDIISANAVRAKLKFFSLISKDPEHLKDGMLVLGLEVWEECNTSRWKQGSLVPELLSVLT